MAQLTFNDYMERISMIDLLTHAGFKPVRGKGKLWPWFAQTYTDAGGKTVTTDKFMVSGSRSGMCSRPPEQKNYNLLSFIKTFPYYFPEYQPGMNLDKLVNDVCRSILNQPKEESRAEVMERLDREPFDLSHFDTIGYNREDRTNTVQFYPYFRQRGIDMMTQIAFSEHFMLAANNQRKDGKVHYSLCFPYQQPGYDKIIGMEQRGKPRKDGTTYKGMALGTDSTNGLWIANLTGKPLNEAKKVMWFESAYDAMACYQIMRKAKEPVKAVYVSTGGSVSKTQVAHMLEHTPEAEHHLCFDRDKAGLMFSCNFMMQKEGRNYSSTISDGTLHFVDRTHEDQNDHVDFDLKTFSIEDFREKMGLKDDRTVFHPCASGYKDWNDQLLDKPSEKEILGSDVGEKESEEENQGKGIKL